MTDTECPAAKRARVHSNISPPLVATSTEESPIEMPTLSGSAAAAAAVADITLRLKVSNLPKHIAPNAFKKFLTSLGLVDPRVKKAPKWDYAFVTFADAEAKAAAREKLSGALFKASEVSVSDADVLQRDRDAIFEKKRAARSEEAVEDTRSPWERLADQVTALWRQPYDEQLAEKHKGMTKNLSSFRTKLRGLVETSEKEHPLLAWVVPKSEFGFNLPCTLHPTVASPAIDGYRTKCEFTVGTDMDGVPTVGFLLGMFKDGIVCVLSPEQCLHVGDEAKAIAAAFQVYVRSSPFPVYDRVAKQGVWRTLLTRTQRTGEAMVMVQLDPSTMTPEQVVAEKAALVTYFSNAPCRVDTLLVQEWSGSSNGITDKAPIECLTGSGYVHEELLGCRFQLSPLSFFQVNTPATELLYRKCADWATQRDESLAVISTETPIKTVLLDLCCGTGTIGITLAKHFDRVIGVEIVESAVKDAIRNAADNEVTNVEYICSKVEDAMRQVVGMLQPGDHVAAILDPPRAGVHASVIRAIRECSAIDHVVYIACDAKQATQNFIDLCRPTSNRYAGRPFRPCQAQPVDLFPHTVHCELVMEFRRIPAIEEAASDEGAAAKEAKE